MTDASGGLTRKPKNLSKNRKESKKCPRIKKNPKITQLIVEIPEVNIISLFGKKVYGIGFEFGSFLENYNLPHKKTR